jgi:hypothetical protein
VGVGVEAWTCDRLAGGDGWPFPTAPQPLDAGRSHADHVRERAWERAAVAMPCDARMDVAGVGDRRSITAVAGADQGDRERS